MTVGIPEDKVQKLLRETDQFLSKPVIGVKQLRSYAGGLSFVAGLIPHLRPFLSSIWTALARCTTNDERYTRTFRRLVHRRRVEPALRWVRALLGGQPGPLIRTFFAERPITKAVIVTDASPWGMGGILRIDGRPVEIFYEPLHQCLLDKFNAQPGLSKHNTLWEAVAILVAFRLWLRLLPYGATYKAKSDNLSFLAALSAGRTKSPALNIVAREIALDQAQGAYQVTGLAHIPGVTNVQADALSRLFSPEAKEFPPELCGVSRRRPDLRNINFWKV